LNAGNTSPISIGFVGIPSVIVVPGIFHPCRWLIRLENCGFSCWIGLGWIAWIGFGVSEKPGTGVSCPGFLCKKFFSPSNMGCGLLFKVYSFM